MVEYDDVALVRFFKSIKNKYSSNALWVVNLKGLPHLHKFLKNQMQLYVATKSKTFNANEIDNILMMLQEDDKPKSTLQGLAIALLHYGLLRGAEVAMITFKDVSITTVGSQYQIEVMFLYNGERRNEGFEFFIPGKFYPIFLR